MFQNIRDYYQKMIPHLSNEEWIALEDKLKLKTFKKGDAIVKQGDVSNYVYFIEKGFCRIYNTINQKEISTGFIGENEYVSIYDSFLTRKPATENLECLEDIILFALHYDDMQFLYNQYPVFQIFGRKIAEMLFIHVSQRSNALLLLTPEQRYQRMIDNGSNLLQKVPQYMLASYIGVTPEHLSRIRKKKSLKSIDIYQ
ncbi:MAG: Crp/Fnr family transcriptional regulator [Chitinophagaceae bacterium]